MIRTQVQLTEEQVEALRRASAERNESMADLIRQSVDLFLRQESRQTRAARLERARAAAGRFASGMRDVSVEHDRHLAEAIRQ